MWWWVGLFMYAAVKSVFSVCLQKLEWATTVKPSRICLFNTHFLTCFVAVIWHVLQRMVKWSYLSVVVSVSW